jgi:hypothetical protein
MKYAPAKCNKNNWQFLFLMGDTPFIQFQHPHDRDWWLGSCNHGNETSGSIKGGELTSLAYYLLLKWGSAPWSQFVCQRFTEGTIT